MVQNGLCVNPDKTQIMKFGNNFSKEYFAFGTTVQITNVCKYFVDKKLTFKFHIEHVCKKLTKFCGIVWKARYVFSKQQMLRFYKAYVNPTITYGILIYGNTSQSHLNEIMKLQKRILRAIFSNVDMNQLRILWTKTNSLLFLIYIFLRCLSTCLWNCDRTKKMVFCLRFTPKKVDHVPGAKGKA